MEANKQALLLFLCIVFISAIGANASTWCIAKPSAPEPELQKALDYACNQDLVNCLQIQPGHECYDPVNLHSHASFAFNQYYQAYGKNAWNCDFSGMGLVITGNPGYASCKYPSP